MDSMFTNLPHFLIGIGLLLLIIEVLMGFTTILLLTLGIAMMLVSGLMYIGILNEALLDAFIAIAIIDAILTLVLWRPLKLLQKDRAPKEVKSDWIGTQFDLESDVAPGAPGTARFSGVVWTVKSSSAIKKGATAEVVKVEVGVLHVQPI
ncbi:NfeD family protein [uncultured Alteromonas sp.]|jgi:membrane protein implicated in regulation of membrane protease activity|uniref:NfeD family protein n=1 Tax=uncultured Alteromonas sp. TaxID=179113 RepID=UPI0030D243C4|tara:strand:+ start:164 stop:613 length:450 start_codon:yes stop_codon:yes gene_type:complete